LRSNSRVARAVTISNSLGRLLGSGMAASDVHVIGWDLDMTLVDSRPGIAATLTALALERDTAIDVDLVINRLGPTLETELAHWFAPDDIDEAADRFRQ